MSPSIRERQNAGLEKGRVTQAIERAHRAVDDPVTLEKAARIVRAALARRKLTLDDLEPLPLPAPRNGSAA